MIIWLLLGISLGGTPRAFDPSKKKKISKSTENLIPDDPPDIPFREFYSLMRSSQIKLCNGVNDLDRSKESALKILKKLIDLIEVTGSIDDVDHRLTIMLSMDKLEYLKNLTEETDKTVDEISQDIETLFFPVPVDDRTILEKGLDFLGIDMFSFYVVAAGTLIFSTFTFIRFHGKGLVERFGPLILMKICFVVFWILNLPAAYQKELEVETAKWKSAQLKEIPAECLNIAPTMSDRIARFLSWNTIDPCIKFHQEMIEPRYRVSWLAIATKSGMEVISPIFTEITRGIRSSLDTLLDGKGLYHQMIYSSVTLVVFIFGFMWMTGFKFKLSSLLFGIEFGPEKERESHEDQINLLRHALQAQIKETLKQEVSKALPQLPNLAKQEALLGPNGDSPVENLSKVSDEFEGL